MTVIIGLEHEGDVYMGADAAVTDYGGYIQSMKRKKVFKNGEFLFGCEQSVRMTQLLECAKFDFGEIPKQGDYQRFLSYVFIDAIREIFDKQGFKGKLEEGRESNYRFLLGFRGELYLVDSDYQVTRMSEGYYTLGSGSSLALGSMGTTESMGLSPRNRIELALTVAGRFQSSVQGPYIIECQEKGSGA